MDLIPDGEGLEEYGDHEIKEFENTPVPLFLKVTYLIVAVIGAVGMGYFWHGSKGFFDRGYWHELQIVAGTTRDASMVERPRLVKLNDRDEGQELTDAPSWRS